MKKISEIFKTFLLGFIVGSLFAILEVANVIFRFDYRFDNLFSLLSFALPPALLYSFFFGLLAILIGAFLPLTKLKKVGPHKLALAIVAVYVGLFAILWAKIEAVPDYLKVDKILTEEEETPKKPNIVWIVIDAGRADHFSSYGYPRPTTPNIDRIATEGILFKNAVSVAGWTVPSHASMFTGLQASAHNADGIGRWLDSRFVTIAEILRKEGYQTGAITNNRNVSPDTNLFQGFDTFVILGAEPNLPNHNNLFLGKLLLKYKDFIKIPPQFLGLTLYGFGDSGGEKTKELASSFLEAKSKVPFFLFIHFQDVHRPYGDTPGAEKFLSEIGISPKEAKKERDNFEKSYPQNLPKMLIDERLKETLIALYDGDLSYTDSRVGEIVKKLRDLQILDNTLLIVTSDHGENLGERDTVGHIYDLHRTITHIPLIVRYPEKFGVGEVERLVDSTDIFPTILNVAGIKYEGEYQGYSLLDPSRPQVAVSEYNYIPPELDRAIEVYDNDKYLIGNWKSLQTPEYDYIETERTNFLYNLMLDPYEKNNLVDSEPSLVQRFSQMLKNLLAKAKEYNPPEEKDQEAIDDRLKRLKNIEY